MTRLEKLREASVEEIAKILCKIHDRCGDCPASEYCGYEHKGFIDWLQEEDENV